MTRIAIIGAGLAGLTAARALSGSAHVTVFDKSRGVSGRVSTRRGTSEKTDQQWQLDHGCPSLWSEDDATGALITELVQHGVVQPWQPRCANLEKDGTVLPEKSEQHYVGVPGMNAIGKHLAQDLSVMTSQRIIKLKRQQAEWFLTSETGDQHGPFDWVISAIPSDQALALLPPDLSFRDHLQARRMSATYCLMLGLTAAEPFPWDVLTTSHPAAQKIMANHSKPGRADQPGFVIYAAPDWSQDHIDDSRDDIAAHMLKTARQVIHIPECHIGYQALQGWRYAMMQNEGTDAAYGNTTLNIIACGDWCLSGDVRSALKSGLAAAHMINHSRE